jgi:hypothetical protein
VVPDLETSLLNAALEFARSRVDELLSTVATDAEDLLLAGLAAASAPQRAAAAASGASTDLVDAKGHFATFSSDLAAGPASLAGVQVAVGELGLALSSVNAAATKVATAAVAAGAVTTADQVISGAVKAAVHAGGDAVSGLLDFLGLGGDSIADGITASGTTVGYAVTDAGPHSLAGPAVLTLSGSSLRAALNYGTLPVSLSVSLQTTLGIGMVADGFVQQLLGDDATASATLTVTVDTARGLTFQAGSKNRADLPGSLSIAGVVLNGLGIELPSDAPDVFTLTGTLSGDLGPIHAVVQGAGVALTFNPAALTGGGGSPASLALWPPSGAGLTVDAGPISGGGFVMEKDGEYGGVLDLSLGPIEIQAFGLLGTDPFSLVLVLSVRFTPAIQLSFGFTLNAVGGLLALERTISTDALRAGLHDHTADTLLFPENAAAAAPTLLDLLRATFPPQPGGFVVGPLLELGWGAPVSFVTARVGVLIALPDPKVILIGSLRVALPLPDAAIVDIRADLYGEITPDHLLFLVSLSGSNVAGFALAGDFGMLIAWGDNPDLAISAGGFHPHYSPPGELAGMRRVSVDLSPPSFLTMRAEAYLALTSNSFQLGTRVELRADVAGVGAEGHLEFDALVRWAPTFHFEIDLSAGVSLYAFGESFASVDLSLHLEGPGPWIASGSASISLLFFDVDLDIPRIVWGDGDPTPPPQVHPQLLVHDELTKPACWEARLPPDTDMLVRLADLPDDATVVVHPLGALEARQHLLPLETVIDRLGPNSVDVTRVNLGAPTVGGNPAAAVSNAADLFSPGEFLNLTDDEKLSRPAFEPFPSGIVIAASTSIHGNASDTDYHWDTICPNRPSPRTTMEFTSLMGVHDAMFASGAAGRGFVSASNPYDVPQEPVALSDPGGVRVLSTRDLGVLADVPTESMTTTAAARVVEGLPAGTAQWAGAGVGA